MSCSKHLLLTHKRSLPFSSSLRTTTTKTTISLTKHLLPPSRLKTSPFLRMLSTSSMNNINNNELTTTNLSKLNTNSSYISEEYLNDSSSVSSNTSYEISINDDDYNLNSLNLNLKESSLESLLDLKQISNDTFINKSELFIPYRGRGLFGGTMAAQSVLAALYYSNTLEKSWKPISIHCHFLDAVQPNPTLYYKVINLKDGKNYCTHEVQLYQNDKLVFKSTVSLQAYQLNGSASNLEGQLNHHRNAPIIGKDIKKPSEMLSQEDLFKIWAEKSKNKKHLEYLNGKHCHRDVTASYNREPCIWKLPQDLFDDELITDEERNLAPSARTLRYWVKTKELLKTPSIFNWVAIAYISDYFYLSTNMRLNMRQMFTTKFSVSLDHTIYFNEEIDTSCFFNYNVKNIKAGENRSIMIGEMFSAEGKLAATTVQEGLSVIYTDC